MARCILNPKNLKPSELLLTLYPKGLPGYIEIRCLSKSLADRSPIRGWCKDLRNPAVVKGLDYYCASTSSKGYDIYYSVCARSEKSGKKNSVSWLPGLWVDVDKVDDEARQAIKSFPLKPSLVISSGRGLHLYWLFPEPIRIDREAFVNLEILLKILCVRCRGDINTCDLSRILRLPGTRNQKNGRTASVIRNGKERYTILEILNCLMD